MRMRGVVCSLILLSFPVLLRAGGKPKEAAGEPRDNMLVLEDDREMGRREDRFKLTPQAYVKLRDAVLQWNSATGQRAAVSKGDRIAAIGNLGMVKEKRVVLLLMGLVADADLRQTIASSVPHFPPGDAEIEVRQAAIWALGEIGDPRSLPVLLQVWAHAYAGHPRCRYPDSQGKTRDFMEFTESAIGKIGQKVMPRLIEAVTGIKDYSAWKRTKDYRDAHGGPNYPGGDDSPGAKLNVDRRRSALLTMSLVGARDTRTVDILTEVMTSTDRERYPPDFRRIAANGLGRVALARLRMLGSAMGAIQNALDPLFEEILDLLVFTVVTDDDADLRDRLYGWLGRIGKQDLPHVITTRSDALLMARLSEDLPVWMRARGIRVLGLLRSGRAVGELMAILKDEREHVLRSTAALSLGLIGDRRATTALVAALGDRSSEVRFRAAAALAMLRSGRAVPALRKCLEDQSQVVRLYATAALGSIRGEEATAALVEAVTNEDRKVRVLAVAILRRVGGSGAVSAFITAAGDRDARVRAAANKALRQLQDVEDEAQALALLPVFVRTEDKTLRRKILRLFPRKEGQPGAIGFLVEKGLKSGDASIRLGVAKYLVQSQMLLNSAAAAEGVISLLEDPDKEVQAAIDRLLREEARKSSFARRLAKALLESKVGEKKALSLLKEVAEVRRARAVLEDALRSGDARARRLAQAALKKK